MKVLKRGAEAVVYRQAETVVKERIAKGYRLKEIDTDLRKQRNKREVKCLMQAYRAGVDVPKVISHDEFTIKMEFIDGPRVKDVLNENVKEISKKIGEVLSKLHEKDIAHGDFTTSNMILKNKKVYLIDFGLSEITKSVESKATDIYVLEEALKSAHFEVFDIAMKTALDSYKKNYAKWQDVLDQLKKIKLRVRYADRT